MVAQIKIDQTGLSAGTADRSRSDGLATGAVVTLTSVTPGTSNIWQLLWVPDDDTTAISTLVSSGAVVTFTPTASVYGTYRIKLTVDSIDTSIRTFSIRTANRGLRIPALNERSDSDASLINSGSTIIVASETNESGSYSGYYPAFVELFEIVDSIAPGSAPVDVTKATASAGVSSSYSRSDHKHNITTAIPSLGIGGGNSEGTSSSLARSDHSHALRTTSGPTDLTIGAILHGEFLQRSGSFFVGATVSTGSSGSGITARRTINGPVTASILTTDHVIFVNTISGSVMLTLPDPASSSAIYEIKDISGSFGTNACTLARNSGGDQIEGLASNYALEANWQSQRVGSDGLTKWWFF